MDYKENRTIEKLNIFLDENFENSSFSLESLYREIGVSRTQLHRIVKELYSLSISLYVRKRRMQRAKSLLNNTDQRISDIAYAVGLNSPQNFSKYFFKEFNISPSDYKKQYSLSETETTPEILGTKSIAVLPFINMSADPDQDYFSDGISEEIINKLSQIQSLKVTARTSSFAFKGKNMDLRQIGKELNVEHILEGSVRKSDSKLRIVVQLIKVKDGFHLWSEKFDKKMEDIFDIQDEISLDVLKEVKIQLFDEEKQNVLKRFTDNSEAYQLYLHGRFYHNKFAGLEEYQTAIKYFESAIAISPDFVLAYSGIASSYLNLWFYRHLRPESCLPQMLEATQKSLELDKRLEETQIAIGRMKMFYEWDFKSAGEAFKKALIENPNKADTNCQFALYLALIGNNDLAVKHIKHSLFTDPFSLINNFYAGYVYWIAGDFEKAIYQGEKLVELEPNFWGGHILICFNSITMLNFPKAKKAIDFANKTNKSGITLSAEGVYYALSGNIDKAREIIIEMEQLDTTRTLYNYDFGIVHASLGEIEKASMYFEKAIEKHEPPMLFFKFILRDWLKPYFNEYKKYIQPFQ